jgi:hypothetical protein
LRAGDEFELLVGPRLEDLSGWAGGGDDCGDEYVWIEDRAHALLSARRATGFASRVELAVGKLEALVGVNAGADLGGLAF